jgi:hypothetical protein
MLHAQAVYWEGPSSGHVDASDAGLPPGEWPETLPVQFPEGVVEFSRTPTSDNGGVLYKAQGPVFLTVYND